MGKRPAGGHSGLVAGATSDRRAFLALAWPERLNLVAAALLLPVVTLLLRVIGWQRLERLGARIPPRRSPSLDAAAVDHAVRVAGARSPVPSACLSRSLTLSFLLRRQGIEHQLCIGARRDDGRFEAHAWVELDGEPLNDAPDVRAHFSHLYPAE